MPDSLRIDAPTAPLALSLIERLDGFHAEVVPSGGERFQVRIDLDGRNGADRVLVDSLDRVERWLESTGLAVAEVHLNRRAYRLERRDVIPVPARPPTELEGLVCLVRTIPLGAGLQVVAARGELDLHTTAQLEEALRSTDSVHVILDLTDVPFVDSTALGAIVASTKSMRADERQLIVIAGNPTVSRVISITGLGRVLTVRPSLAEAITSALDGLATPAR